MTKYLYIPKSRTFERIPEFIYQRRNGGFEIRKRISGILIYWGSYPTLEEANLHRAYYIGKKWEVKPAFKADKHIIQRGDTYIILKEVGGKMVSFGTFDNLEDARHERDICAKCHWDFDLIVEYAE